MKVRPIDANATISELRTLPEQERLEYMGVYDLLKSMPTLDYEPVVHAHFIKQRHIPHFPFQNVYECSHCHCITHVGHNYCMECGAKMDEEVK